MTESKNKRLDGIELARCIALLGMVLVNFRMAMMGNYTIPNDGLFAIMTAFEGKSAALFVVLAGIGLGLSTRKITWFDAQLKLFYRSVFLFVIGILNVAIFSADIIHFYAIYFTLAGLYIRLPSRFVLLTIPLLSLLSILLYYQIDFDTGWNWTQLTYTDFWTFNGFMRSLWFNGFHPIIPWLGFVLFGLYLSRLDLTNLVTQRWLLYGGAGLMLFTNLLSQQLTYWLDGHPICWIFSTSPIPPTPFYLLSAGGLAVAILGFCLLICRHRPNNPLIQWIIPAGRQTLTLYIMHILLAMTLLESLNLLYHVENIYLPIWVAISYFIFAIVFANLWARFFKNGLLESIPKLWI